MGSASLVSSGTLQNYLRYPWYLSRFTLVDLGAFCSLSIRARYWALWFRVEISRLLLPVTDIPPQKCITAAIFGVFRVDFFFRVDILHLVKICAVSFRCVLLCSAVFCCVLLCSAVFCAVVLCSARLCCVVLRVLLCFAVFCCLLLSFAVFCCWGRNPSLKLLYFAV